MHTIFCRRALLPPGWRRDVAVTIGDDGGIAAVEAGVACPAGAQRAGTVMPGFGNAHSHAFQRALAGRTEYAGPAADTFWSWRETMYALAASLQPRQVEAIATWLYVQLLEHGYTSVGEFHYLHHGPDGAPLEPASAMAQAVAEAAARAGIDMTLLPVLYRHGDFGGKPATGVQRRFASTVQRYLDLVQDLLALQGPGLTVGLAFHSLRAVSAEDIAEVLAQPEATDAAVIHVHVAEQQREVEACLAWSGQRPVEWLLDHGGVDRRWCLVHATHSVATELQRVAGTGATVALCPSTEANLADGVFPLADFLAAGGSLAIGSDSHVCVDPFEELRWLEYGQRLVHGRRNVVAPVAGQHSGAALACAALAGGAAALGRAEGALAAGCRANLLVLDDTAPELADGDDESLLDRAVFAAAAPVRDVMVGGQWVVTAGRHGLHDEAAAACRALLAKIPGRAGGSR